MTDKKTENTMSIMICTIDREICKTDKPCIKCEKYKLQKALIDYLRGGK